MCETKSQIMCGAANAFSRKSQSLARCMTRLDHQLTPKPTQPFQMLRQQRQAENLRTILRRRGIPYLELNCYYSFHPTRTPRVCIFFQNMFYLFFKLLTKTFSLEILSRARRRR